MNALKNLVLIASFSTFNFSYAADAHQKLPKQEVENYQPINAICDGPIKGVGIRSFKLNGASHLLLVDPYTLKTTIHPSSETQCKYVDRKDTSYYQETPYFQALEYEKKGENALQNAGISHALRPVKGFFLTADLCPTTKSWVNKVLFETVEHALDIHHQLPLPIGLSVSGSWLSNHPEALEWLLDNVKSGKLDITWVNHTLSHPYHAHEDHLEHNFMLSDGVNVADEILGLEKRLIEYGLIPSVFMRFPGLVSNTALIEYLRELNLIALGSNAWIAKGEIPHPGSVILVHGNNNEPKGVRMLLSWVIKNYDNLSFLPLNALVTEKDN